MSEAIQESEESQTLAETIFENGLPPVSWQEYAKCKGADRDEFFFPPRTGRGSKDPHHLIGRYCNKCFVQYECLAASVVIGDKEVTIAGGMTIPERTQVISEFRLLQKAQKAAAAPPVTSRAPRTTVTPIASYAHLTAPVTVRTVEAETTLAELPLAEVVSMFKDAVTESQTTTNDKKPQLGAELARLILERGQIYSQLQAANSLRNSYEELAQLVSDDVISSREYDEVLDKVELLTAALAELDAENTQHDPRWQGVYVNRPPADPDRVTAFLASATPEEVQVIKNGINPRF